MHGLTSKFIDSKVDMANIVRDQARRMHGEAARPAAAVRPSSPTPLRDPFKNSHVCSRAWAQHNVENGAAGAIGSAWREHHSP